MIHHLSSLLFLIGLYTMPLAAEFEEQPPVQYLQVYLGSMQIENDHVEIQDTDNGEISTNEFPDDLPWAGGVAQMPYNQGRIQYGIESGGFISWKNSDTEFSFFNGTARFKVESSLLLIDLFLGAYMSTNIGDRVRLHAGLGPMLLFGRLDLEDTEDEDDNETNNGKSVVIVSGGTRIVLADDDTDSDLVFGGYARIGIDFRLDEENAVGISARYIHAEPDFNDSFGRVVVKGPQIFLTLTRRY